ncbi:hypothetical protein AURDEDRAFT_162099 [Auricularia subglabra TFB-10046 SS5]|nr:hypothetical protein AURDEDRAFT_162099 [Auricularia subglabra TFB-10046 SS5]
MALPGGHGFADILPLIEQATNDMQPGELMIMENFGLQDAMSAVEIMDERMDSGARPPATEFDLNALLLPEEVCWILDKALAAEMTWHSGQSLAQSVLTLQYVRALPRMHPDVFLRGRRENQGDRRPELICMVLRAGVLALIKCVDLAWRELAKNNVYDGEDWHSEKFEVSLCEGVAVATVVDILDEAIDWLHGAKKTVRIPSSTSPQGKVNWYSALIRRLELRRTVLLALSRSLPSEADELRNLGLAAQSHLNHILDEPHIPAPSPRSPAHHAFDPYVCSTLTVLMPVKAIELLPEQETTIWLRGLLDGLLDVAALCGCERLITWTTFARLSARTSEPQRRSAFLRSLCMTTFMSGNLVLGKYQSPWLVDHYLGEIARVPQALLMRLHEEDAIAIPNTNSRNAASVLQLFENDVIVCLKEYYYSFFQNRARQRRKLSNGLLDMHKLRALAADCARQVRALGHGAASYVKRVELVLHALRLATIAEVALSGFELELYSPEERAFVYWYTASVLKIHALVLRELLGHLHTDGHSDRSAEDFASSELDFANGLHAACLGSLFILRLVPARARTHELSPERLRINIGRRFKWAYDGEYANIPVQDQVRPDYDAFCDAPEHNLQDANVMQEAQNLFDAAAESFAHVRLRDAHETGAELNADAQFDFMQHLIDVCMANAGYLRVAQTHEQPERRLKWDVRLDGWLQRINGFSIVEPAQ